MSGHDLESLLGANVLRELDRPTPTALGLPARVYHDPEIFALECERLFPRTWMAAAVASDIPEPGDATVVTLGRRNVLLVRDKERQVRGYYNACRHRGMRLLCEPARGLRSLVCPFHGWTYGLDGRLRGTPHLGGVGVHTLEGFEREELGLVPVAVGQWCNTLLVNLDGGAPPLEQFLAPLLEYLGERDWDGLYHHKPASIQANEAQGNWKEYVEVSMEEFHIKAAHPQVFEGIDPLTWRDDPVVDRHLFGSQALLSGSYGAGAAYYRGEPLPHWLDKGERWQSYVLLFPNLGVWATSDQLSIDFHLPLSPDRYAYRQEFYFSPEIEPLGRHQGALQALFDAWALLQTQDHVIFEGLRANRHTNEAIGNRTRFAGAWEVNLHHFQKQYVLSLQA